MIISDEKAVYHVVSRTALDGFPFGDVEKDTFVSILKRLSCLYFAEILGFCVMSNHVHILVKMHPGKDFSDEAIRCRFEEYHGDDTHFPVGRIHSLRDKWASLSEFVKDVKHSFSRYYNKRHHKKIRKIRDRQIIPSISTSHPSGFRLVLFQAKCLRSTALAAISAAPENLPKGVYV